MFVKLLLGRGADMESRCRLGKPPLLWAAENAREAVVMLILNIGVDIKSPNMDDRSSLWYAEHRGGKDAARLLLERYY